jgi:hypothetical protein
MRAMLSLTGSRSDFEKKRAWAASREMKAGHSLGVPLTLDAIQILKALPRNGAHVFQWHGKRIDDCNTLANRARVRHSGSSIVHMIEISKFQGRCLE